MTFRWLYTFMTIYVCILQKSDSEGDEENLDLEKSLREKALESLNRHKARVDEDDRDEEDDF